MAKMRTISNSDLAECVSDANRPTSHLGEGKMTNKFIALFVLSFVLAVLTLTTTLAAQSYLAAPTYKESGSSLLEQLKLRAEPLDDSFEAKLSRARKTWGYVVGIADALHFEGVICLPPTIADWQIAAVIDTFLTVHPERLHEPGIYLTHTALVTNFPPPERALDCLR